MKRERNRLFTSGKKMNKGIPLLVMLMQGQHQRVTGRVYLCPVTTLKCFKLVTLITNRLKTGYGHTGMVAKDIREKEESTAR